MSVSRRRLLLLCALTGASGLASAQAYPVKPVRLIVPFPPGAYTDTVARLVGEKLAERIRQPVVVENRAGAGGNIGADYVAKAAPDGYTLLMGTIANAISVSAYSKLPYRLTEDLTPVSLVVSVPNVLVVNAQLPIKSVPELINFARSNPGKLAYASSGNGAAPHLAGELFKTRTNIDLIHVPYKGIGPALTDVMGGQTAMMFTSLDSALAQLRGGKLRALAVTSSKRSPLLPQIPTMIEEGLTGFEVVAWGGILAPAGTPKDIVATLNSHLDAVLRSPEVTKRFLEFGAEPVPGAPDDFTRFLNAEIEKWGAVVKAAGVKID